MDLFAVYPFTWNGCTVLMILSLSDSLCSIRRYRNILLQQSAIHEVHVRIRAFLVHYMISDNTYSTNVRRSDVRASCTFFECLVLITLAENGRVLYHPSCLAYATRKARRA